MQMIVNIQSVQIKTGERKWTSSKYSQAPVIFPWPGYYEVALHVCLWSKDYEIKKNRSRDL